MELIIYFQTTRSLGASLLGLVSKHSSDSQNFIHLSLPLKFIVHSTYPSFINSWSISHILEHEFFCFGRLASSGQLRAIMEKKNFISQKKRQTENDRLLPFHPFLTNMFFPIFKRTISMVNGQQRPFSVLMVSLRNWGKEKCTMLAYLPNFTVNVYYIQLDKGFSEVATWFIFSNLWFQEI